MLSCHQSGATAVRAEHQHLQLFMLHDAPEDAPVMMTVFFCVADLPAGVAAITTEVRLLVATGVDTELLIC